MIEELLIRDLGVISEARLALHEGFTVITGETGAGKTMVLTGIDLVRGGKPDTSRVRAGSERAEVEAMVLVAEGSEAAALLADLEVDLDDGALIIGRTVPVDGRARARLGGRAFPSASLAEVTSRLIAVHGQGDQARLGRSDVQRQILDRVAGDVTAAAYARYRHLLAALHDVQAEISDIQARGVERAAEAARLRALLEDCEALAPQPGEVAALAAESRRLSHGEGLRAAAQDARARLTGDDATDASSLVAAARRALDHERSNDAALGDLADRLAEISALLSDVSADVAAYADSSDSDPRRLDAIERRRAELSAFERRHQTDIDVLLGELPGLSARLESLAGGEERLDELRQQENALREEISPVAWALHEGRHAAATSLAERVGVELAALAMPEARVEWQVTITESDAGGADGIALPDGRRVTLGPHGIDEIALLLSSHRDAPPMPLARAASGGELSRVMLALEVVLAGGDPVTTMVFDEVDAGVGGRAAIEVGRRLSVLGRSTQVLVVTHLAQVAAFADRHIVVTRAGDGEVTTSDVVEVTDDDRVRELARMLAGMDESVSAADHARELLSLAASDAPKAKGRRR